MLISTENNLLKIHTYENGNKVGIQFICHVYQEIVI